MRVRRRSFLGNIPRNKVQEIKHQGLKSHGRTCSMGILSASAMRHIARSLPLSIFTRHDTSTFVKGM
jgi:hypothetical protein